jgi:glycosyltransferase involved in cell wall biosynthesis
MRLLHWYPNFFGGGAVTASVLELANAQARAGAEVWIAGLAELRKRPSVYGPFEPGDDVHLASWSGGRPLGYRGANLHLMGVHDRRDFRALHPDVVHAHGEFNPDNWWAPQLFRCPLVLAPRGAFHPLVRARGAMLKRAYIAAASPLLYRHVARFHALTPAEQGDIEDLIPYCSVYCAPNARRAFATQPERDCCDPTGPVRFLFLGRMDIAAKGLDVLLEAFALASRRGGLTRRVTLSLVGPDHRHGKSLLRALAARFGIEHLLEIAEPVTADEVTATLQRCDVYVQVSRNEAFGRSVADALAFGKPVIVSAAVGIVSYREIARQPHIRVISPTVSETAEAIAQTVRDLDTLRPAAERARPELDRFLSADRIAALHLGEYASLIGVGPA